MNEKVNHPNHYNNGKVECIDAIESATVNKNGIEAFCVGNIIKYLWRYEDKNGIEDINKAKWYLDFLLSAYDKLPICKEEKYINPNVYYGDYCDKCKYIDLDEIDEPCCFCKVITGHEDSMLLFEKRKED